jgi:hypothetical protein
MVAGLLLAQAALVGTSSSSYSLDNCRRDPTRTQEALAPVDVVVREL